MGTKMVQDSSLTAVANAIRTKGGTSADLTFPSGFVNAIGDIPNQNTKLLRTLTFENSNAQQDITPDSSWDQYDFLLFVPDLTVTKQEGSSYGNWLWFSFTGDRGTNSNYDGMSAEGKRDKTQTVVFLKGWTNDRYYWRWAFLYSGRGGSLQLKTVLDYDSEEISDLTFKYGAYYQSTYALLNGTVNIYGVKLPTDDGEWVRPSEYPDIDALADQIVGDQDCVYLTYDLRKSDVYRWIGLYAVTDDSSAWTVDRGHVTNNAFVVDETWSINSNSYLREYLNSANGDVQLFRVTATGHITKMSFVANSATNAENFQNNMQPCVQRAGTLPWCTVFGDYPSTLYNAFVSNTVWMERDALVPAKKAVVTTMRRWWFNCWNLQSLDLSKWDTSNWEVTRFDGCWNNCYKLKTIDLSSFDTSNWEVTTFESAFANCYSLENLNIGVLDTSNWEVNTLAYVFQICSSLKRLDLRGWDVSNWAVTSMSNTCEQCRSLEVFNATGWDTSNWTVNNNNNLFPGSKLNTIKGTNTWAWATAMTVNTSVPNLQELVDFDGIPYSVNQNYSSALKLTHDSLVRIINCLPTVETSKTLTLGQTNSLKLTSAEIAVATQKGWTVA